MSDAFTIKQAAERTGLTADALRYYEKIGLLPSVKRKKNGHRIYHLEDIKVMELIICLKKTGMSLEDMKTYVPLSFTEDITSVPEVHAKFLQYRQKIQQQVDDLHRILQLIDYKLNNHQSLLNKQTDNH